MVILASLSDARLCRENAPPGAKRAGRGDRVAARPSDVNEQDSPAAPSEDDAATRRSGIDIRTGQTASQRPPLVDPVEPPPAKYPNRLEDLSALRQSRGSRRRRGSMRHRRAKRISSEPSILRGGYALRALDRDLARFIPIFQTAGLDRRRFSLRSHPFDIVVERNDRAGQALPFETGQHRRGEAGQVYFDDLVRSKELVEAAAEMAARLDDDRTCPGDVEPHHLEKDRIGALHAMRDHDDGDPADLERGAGSELKPQSGVDAAAADAVPVGQCDDSGRRGVRLGELRILRPVEPRL